MFEIGALYLIDMEKGTFAEGGYGVVRAYGKDGWVGKAD